MMTLILPKYSIFTPVYLLFTDHEKNGTSFSNFMYICVVSNLHLKISIIQCINLLITATKVHRSLSV